MSGNNIDEDPDMFGNDQLRQNPIEFVMESSSMNEIKGNRGDAQMMDSSRDNDRSNAVSEI